MYFWAFILKSTNQKNKRKKMKRKIITSTALIAIVGGGVNCNIKLLQKRTCTTSIAN